MDNIHTALLKLITKGCWMPSLDLKDAYYSVPIHPASQNVLKFTYKAKSFKFRGRQQLGFIMLNDKLPAKGGEGVLVNAVKNVFL
jgi:hypothetical protein